MSEVIWYYDEAEGGGVQKVAGLGSYIKAEDFHDMEADRDAQRLRADTAEAERDERKRKHLRSCQIAIGKSQLAKELQSKLAAAEQRIAELAGLLQYVRTKPGFFSGEFVLKLDAALNQKSEGESQ